MQDTPHFYARNRAEWRLWLKDHHVSDSAVWLVYDKGVNRTLSWADIVKEALCYGWIDSRPGKVSETQSKIYISKRRPKSVWSKINKTYVSELINEGLMQPAGRAAIDVAKQNGSWDALNLSDALVYPLELVEEFERFPIAAQNFESFPETSRRNTLQWIYDARTDQTRANRVEQVIGNAEKIFEHVDISDPHP